MTPQDKTAGALSLHCFDKSIPTRAYYESRTILCAGPAGEAGMFSFVQMDNISSAIIKTIKKTSHYF